jgi:hypothetical protein
MILLKNKTYLLVSQRRPFLRLEVVNGNIIEKEFSGPAVVMHSKDVQERGFAGAGRAHDRDELALFDLEVDVTQNIKKTALGEWITAFDMV